MKKYTRFKSIYYTIDSLIRRRRKTFRKGVIVAREDEAFDVFSKSFFDNSHVTFVDHYSARLIYEYLMNKKRVRGDYSNSIYLADDYRISNALMTVSKNSLDHVAVELLKDIETADTIVFESLKKEERLLLTSITKKIRFILKCDHLLDESDIYSYLEGKRVLVISPHSELIKIQHLHQGVLHLGMTKAPGKFTLHVIDSEEIFKREEVYSFFEKLDALKVEILKYEFDVALVNLSLLGIPTSAFIANLNKSVINLDKLLYQVFGVALSSAEKSQHDNFWVDLEAYKKGIDSTFLATGVIGAPIKIGRSRRRKDVH